MKHKFLALFGGIAAAFASGSAQATMPMSHPNLQTSTSNALHVISPDGQVIVRDQKGDEFEFVLKNSEQTGVMMAGHRSHRSHSSHRSHYSSR